MHTVNCNSYRQVPRNRKLWKNQIIFQKGRLWSEFRQLVSRCWNKQNTSGARTFNLHRVYKFLLCSRSSEHYYIHRRISSVKMFRSSVKSFVRAQAIIFRDFHLHKFSNLLDNQSRSLLRSGIGISQNLTQSLFTLTSRCQSQNSSDFGERESRRPQFQSQSSR